MDNFGLLTRWAHSLRSKVRGELRKDCSRKSRKSGAVQLGELLLRERDSATYQHSVHMKINTRLVVTTLQPYNLTDYPSVQISKSAPRLVLRIS